MILERTTTIAAAPERLWEFFSDPRNLGRITPPALGFEIVEAPGRSLQKDDRIVYRIRVAGIPVRWITRITEWSPGHSFTDVQERGPYRRWIHRHSFETLEGGLVRMTDRVDYDLPLGPVGRVFGGWWVRRRLGEIFEFRASVIEELFRSGPAAPRR